MKKDYFVLIFIILGPILDVTSFLGLPFSLLLRGFFLAFMILSLFKNKKELRFLIPLLIFGVFYFGYQYYFLHFKILPSLSSILKFLYLPVSIFYFKNYIFPIEKEKIFSMVLITYVSIYLLSYVFGIGANAYLETDGKSGFKGLFSSINEFSAILVCLLPVVAMYFKKKRKYMIVGFFILSCFLCSLLIGTKVLMGGVLFTIFYLLWQERKKLFLERKTSVKIGMVISLLMIIILGCFLFTKTRTYQNMMVQQDFFQVEHIVSIDFVNRIIYNDRLTFLKDNFKYLQNQSIWKIVFGIGLENYDIKMVEIDIFDLMIRYGILGMVLFIGDSILSIRKIKLKPEEKVSMIILILVSLTSGHVLFYPAVCIYLALMLSKENVLKEKYDTIKKK